MLKNNYIAKTHNALTVIPLLLTFFQSCKKDQSATNNSNQEYFQYHGDDKFLKGIVSQLAERADTLDFTLIKGKDEFAWSKAIAYGQLGAKNSFILVPILAQDKTVNTFARVTVLADRVINFKIHSFTAYQTTNDNELKQILSTAASIFNKQGLILNSSVKPMFVPLNKQMSIGGAGNQAAKRSATNQNQICNATVIKARFYTITASPTRMELFNNDYVNEIKSILNILAGLGKFVITYDEHVGLQILGPDFEISQQAILEAKATVEARFPDISFDSFLITPQCFNIPGGGSGVGGGDAPVRDIIDSVKNPCIKAQLANALTAKTTIRNMLNEVFGDTIQYESLNITFTDITTLPADVDGQQKRGSNTSTEFSIELNKNTLPSSSQQYILSTIYHEILHAYLEGHFNKDGNGTYIIPDHHEEMANKYVFLMTGALRVVFPSLNTEEAWALSWGGLQNTTLYTSNLTANQRTQIVDINNRHKSKTAANKLGTYCTP